MLTRASITNFRCFEHVEIDGLKRINLVIGPNGSGKTALLEALFLVLGNSPEIGLRFKVFRGLTNTSADVRVLKIDAGVLWEDLFHRFDRAKAIRVEVEDVDTGRRTLTVVNEDREVRTIVSGFDAGAVEVPLTFTWTTTAGKFQSKPVMTDSGIRYQAASRVGRALLFPAHFPAQPEESAKRLSELSKRGAVQAVVGPLQRLFPNVTGLSVENVAEGAWAPHFELSEGFKIPAALHSAGADRYLQYLLGIATAESGVVLIDEFDNGLYYATLEKAWRGVHELAEARDVQLFATTHSRECMEALVPLLRERPDAFAVLRMSGGGGEPASVERLDPAGFAAALEQGYEVR